MKKSVVGIRYMKLSFTDYIDNCSMALLIGNTAWVTLMLRKVKVAVGCYSPSYDSYYSKSKIQCFGNAKSQPPCVSARDILAVEEEAS